MFRLLPGVAVVLAACGLQAKPLWECTFDNGADGWLRSTDQQPADSQRQEAKAGGALTLTYLPKTPFAGLAAPVPVNLAGARSIKFSLRTSQDSIFAAVLGEEGEYTWLSLVPCAAGAWRDYEISFDRFRPDDQKTDPNGKLETDMIRFVALFDASAFLGQAGDAEKTIWLDGYAVLDDEAANAYSFEHTLPYILDDFQACYHSWITLLGELAHDPEEGTLTWTYDGPAGPNAIPGIGTALGQLPKHATHLYITLRSQRDMNLAILLQEGKRGDLDESNYIALKPLRGGEFETIEIDLRTLQLDTEHSKDENNRFDLDQVGMLLLLDVDLATGQPDGANVVTIDEIELVDEG